MSNWLRFAVVDKRQLQSKEIVTPKVMLELHSDSTSFVAALAPLYVPELMPVEGTEVPTNFRLEDKEDPKGMHADSYGTLHYYTPQEVLEARERALPFYTPSLQDEQMFDTIWQLPENMILVRVLFC